MCNGGACGVPGCHCRCCPDLTWSELAYALDTQLTRAQSVIQAQRAAIEELQAAIKALAEES